MFSHIIIFGSSLAEALGGQSLYTIICARGLTSSFAHLETDIGRKKAARDNGD
jgi:hypothetical protein